MSGCGEQLRDFSDQAFAGRAVFERAVPDGEHVSPEADDGVLVSLVAVAVALDFCDPPLGSGFWNTEIRTRFMPVPEAAVDKDDSAIFRRTQSFYLHLCPSAQSVV